MDRSCKFYGISLAAPEHLYDGSVFDCELVAVKGPVPFLLSVFDCACIEGDDKCGRDPLSKRLLAIACTFPSIADASVEVWECPRTLASANGVIASCMDTLRIVSKPMARLSELESLAAVRQLACPVIDVPCDGYVLTPEAQGAPLPGTAWDVLKVKAVHTIDLLWKDGLLWYGDGDALQTADMLSVPGLRVSAVADVPLWVKSGVIVEMSPTLVGDEHRGESRAVRMTFRAVRKDRDAPNSRTCILGTLSSAKDAVTLGDVI
jgi:hypothetical protein